jgi:hypothetical protein
MRMMVQLLLCLIGWAAFAAAAGAQQQTAAANRAIDWPSPDGRLAFIASYGDNAPHTIDLVDKASGKVLQRIDEEDSSQATWHVLWAPDAKRFALMTRLGHPIQGVDIFVESGDAFRKVDLPDLPEATIPAALKRGKKFPHVASQNWQEATQWTKDGSLAVTVTTTIDGDGRSITATRTVVLGFDRAGNAKVMSSTIKYATATD